MAIDDLYRDLHAHPELSFEETRTATIAAGELRASGFDVIEGVGMTGVVGVLRNGEGPTVLLRADMDALPVSEDTGVAYASTVTGVMHACGHDVHVACLIGAARELAATRAEWSGTVVAVFQPAEEVGGGAQAMLDDGLYEMAPVPDVVLGQHVGPAPAGMVGAHPGAAFASADSIDITIRGRGGHGSRSETTIDPIVIAAAMVGWLQTIVSREIAPQETSVVTVGRINAGTKNNIIPESAELGLSLRAYNEEVRLRMRGDRADRSRRVRSVGSARADTRFRRIVSGDRQRSGRDRAHDGRIPISVRRRGSYRPRPGLRQRRCWSPRDGRGRAFGLLDSGRRASGNVPRSCELGDHRPGHSVESFAPFRPGDSTDARSRGRGLSSRLPRVAAIVRRARFSEESLC